MDAGSLAGEAKKPEAIGDQEMVQRAVDTLEEGAAVGSILVVGQGRGRGVEPMIGPGVVACQSGVTLHHHKAPDASLRRLCPRPIDEACRIAGHGVDLDVEAVSPDHPAPCRHGQRMRDQQHRKVASVDAVHGERGTVERHRTLLGDEAGHGFGCHDVEARGLADVGPAHHGGDAVDMARDDVTAEFVADLERAFEVDALAGLPSRRASSCRASRLRRRYRTTSGYRPRPVATAVRHGPEQAIEAPIAILSIG